MTGKDLAAFFWELAEYLELHEEIPVHPDASEITLSYTVYDHSPHLTAMIKAGFKERRENHQIYYTKRFPHGTLTVTFPDVSSFPGQGRTQ